jgi:hypothetical protein
MKGRNSMRCSLFGKILVSAVLVVASANASHAQDSKAGFFAGAGYLKASDVDGGSPDLTGGFSFKVAPTIALEPEFGYWKKSEGVEDFARVGISDTTFGANLVFRPAIEGPVGVHLGVGPSVHLAKPEWGEDVGAINISSFRVYGGLRVNF